MDSSMAAEGIVLKIFNHLWLEWAYTNCNEKRDAKGDATEVILVPRVVLTMVNARSRRWMVG